MKSTGKTNRREAEKRLDEIMEPFLIENEIKTLQNVKARIEGAKSELAVLNEKRNPPLSAAAPEDDCRRADPRRPGQVEREDMAGSECGITCRHRLSRAFLLYLPWI